MLTLLLALACSAPDADVREGDPLSGLDDGEADTDAPLDDTATEGDTGGADTSGAPPAVEANLSPASYDVGTVYLGCSFVVNYTVYAGEDGSAQVLGVEVEPPDGFAFASEMGAFPWMGGTFTVTFAPEQARAYDAQVAVTVEGGETTRFPLTGAGEDYGSEPVSCDE